MSTIRRRLDVEMVRRGIVESRSLARRQIDSGRVLVGGSLSTKAARLVAASEPITLRGDPPRYVSRGGEKLAAALAAFGIEVSDKTAIDVGASTGGFSDCLLQHGAVAVTSIDVGRNQLHERLRADSRVTSLERTDVRRDDLVERVEAAPVVVADVSFISLRTVAAHILRLATQDVVLLVKPQFEAGKRQADRSRGIIRDPVVWRSALVGVCEAFIDAGATIRAMMVSPLRGAKGNVEFLVHAYHEAPSVAAPFDVLAERPAHTRAVHQTKKPEGSASPADSLMVMVDAAVADAVRAVGMQTNR